MFVIVDLPHPSTPQPHRLSLSCPFQTQLPFAPDDQHAGGDDDCGAADGDPGGRFAKDEIAHADGQYHRGIFKWGHDRCIGKAVA